ncbi:MAG TPA: serine/threonine-protein kinase [Polyangiaceae bacterium]
MASGGMATVFLGSLEGALGFRQLVAIKRPHPHLLENEGFRDALLREARLAAGIHHANVVDVRDVEIVGDSVQLVMDYIEGASLGELVTACAKADRRLPPAVAVRIVLDACAGLHAAHELADDAGHALGLVHRDVSPQNVLVGVDGVARVTDFGIAKCVESTDPGTTGEALKGKVGYMAPEYLHGETLDRRVDVFALGVVLWEALCGRRLFRAQSDGETVERVLSATIPPVSETDAQLGVLDAAVARALARDRETRFATTEELARALEEAAAPAKMVASHGEVGRFVRETVGPRLEERKRALREARLETPAPVAVSVTIRTESRGEPSAKTSLEVPAPRRSRARVAIAIAGGVVLLGAGAVALGRSGAGAATGAARGSATGSAPATATGPATATATGPATASASASATATATARRPLQPVPRATGHLPPPNPNPTGP